jgi:hypothetical protein
VESFKNLLLQNHWARRAHIYMKAFWYNVDSSLYKPWSLGVERGHNREKPYFYVFTLKKIFFSRTSKPISIKLNFACVYLQYISQDDSGERCGPWASCCCTFPPWGAPWKMHGFWNVDGSDQKAIRRNVIGVYTQVDSVRDRKIEMAIVYLQVVFSFNPA